MNIFNKIDTNIINKHQNLINDNYFTEILYKLDDEIIWLNINEFVHNLGSNPKKIQQIYNNILEILYIFSLQNDIILHNIFIPNFETNNIGNIYANFQNNNGYKVKRVLNEKKAQQMHSNFVTINDNKYKARRVIDERWYIIQIYKYEDLWILDKYKLNHDKLKKIIYFNICEKIIYNSEQKIYYKFSKIIKSDLCFSLSSLNICMNWYNLYDFKNFLIQNYKYSKYILSYLFWHLCFVLHISVKFNIFFNFFSDNVLIHCKKLKSNKQKKFIKIIYKNKFYYIPCSIIFNNKMYELLPIYTNTFIEHANVKENCLKIFDIFKYFFDFDTNKNNYDFFNIANILDLFHSDVSINEENILFTFDSNNNTIETCFILQNNLNELNNFIKKDIDKNILTTTILNWDTKLKLYNNIFSKIKLSLKFTFKILY